MEKLLLILADAGLELVPREIWHHPAVWNTAYARGKKPGEILLDISLHYAAAKALKDWRKRGRPDILLTCLLLALSTLLNRRGLLEIVIHTYGGLVIKVDPAVRIPRNYNRFVGLMEQLLLRGKVPPDSEKPLLWVSHEKLEDVVKAWNPDFAVLMHEKGERVHARELAARLSEHERPLVLVGCFQSGEFSEEVLKLGGKPFSYADEVLDAWYVVAKTLLALEDRLGIA
uniref:Ribosomal RNA small subunit methyltransferase Nep1 n=1 Tax=Thermofilum pendens TaxID=2269 RepID=A0A7C4BB88_THEPE